MLLATTSYITEPKYVEVVRGLLEAGADVNQKNKVRPVLAALYEEITRLKSKANSSKEGSVSKAWFTGIHTKAVYSNWKFPLERKTRN